MRPYKVLRPIFTVAEPGSGSQVRRNIEIVELSVYPQVTYGVR